MDAADLEWPPAGGKIVAEYAQVTRPGDPHGEIVAIFNVDEDSRLISEDGTMELVMLKDGSGEIRFLGEGE